MAVSSKRSAVRARGGAAPFFRDASALQALRRLALLRVAKLSPGEPLRAWVPECSGGEDAYSVAICLLETFGGRWREIPLQVFSTDADADALSRARAGRYPAEAGRGVPRKRLARFFVAEHGRIRARPFVRDACRFVLYDPRHDLAQKLPFSRVDVIVGRGTLAALPQAARENALRIFHAALAPGGVLLDPSGAASRAPELFAPVGRGRAYVARASGADALGRTVRDTPIVSARQRESEEKFRILFSRAEDAILVRDTVTDRILQANEAARRLYGWSVPELLSMRGKDLHAASDVVRRSVHERRSEERLRMPHYRRKDGTSFPADASASFLMLHGRPCELLMVRDATPRMRANSGRTREKEHDGFGEVVHELRSPIAVIRGSVETLRKGVRGARARKMFLEFIESHAGRMARLVDRLLDLGAADASRRHTKSARVLLADVVWEIAAGFVPVAKRRGIAIHVDIPAGLAVLVDPDDLPHVFGNLLDNAVKFSPRDGAVFVSGRAEGGEGILSVRDTGGGIAPEDLTRVFERFYRCARTARTKGTGLGLAIVQGIVKANRGRVFAENDPAGGAVFRVALPLAEEIKR
jgi:PAS domain S-box-containing protein